MILDNLFPVFALIVLGALGKRFGLTNTPFLKTADRLVYYIFFPALLFWKIGAAPSELVGAAGFYLAAVCAVALTYILSTAYILVGGVAAYQAGSFSQSCYRFNTYIGVAIMLNAFGESGVRQFGILIGIIIPVINVLAVSTLTWFSGKPATISARLRQTLAGLATNPLILACLGGIAYGKAINYFPPFVDNTLKLAAYVTLPLALLSIGGSLTFRSLRHHFKLSLIAAGFKLVLLPVFGYCFLVLFDVTGLALRIGMIFFTLPTSTALYVLSSQMNSDTRLASASIATSTVLSFFPLSIALTL
jgi:predicted permease